jgi:hypothetical protein
MRIAVPTVIVALVATLAAGEARPSPDAEAADSGPSARDTLSRVIGRLPAEPLRVEGDIEVRRRKGVVIGSLAFSMDLEWGRTPPRARYTIRDRFGGEPDCLTVTRPADGAATYTFERGDPPVPAALTDRSAAVRGTDIGWADLALEFLWWPNARVAGEDEEVRGRPCVAIDVDAPETNSTVRSVRLWVDRELDVLVQAEAYDADAMIVRRVEVRSIKKIDDRWMIKDVDVLGDGDAQRTRLRVREVRPLDEPAGGSASTSL